MELITRKGLAATAAARWASQYRDPRPNSWEVTVYQDLVSLGDSPEPDAVAAAVGNTSWTELRCDECRCLVDEAVICGEEPDYESATATLCRDCLAEALSMLSQ